MSDREICDHCGRRCGTLAGGYGYANKMNLCHPSDPDRPDCYKLVTLWGHEANCQVCKVGPGIEWLRELKERIKVVEFNTMAPDILQRCKAEWTILELHAPEAVWGAGSKECKICSYGGKSCGCVGWIDDWPCETIKMIGSMHDFEYKEK